MEDLINASAYDQLLQEGREHGQTLLTDVLVWTREGSAVVPFVPRSLPKGVEPERFKVGRQEELSIIAALHGETVGYVKIFDPADVLRRIDRRPVASSYKNLLVTLPDKKLHYHVLTPDPEHKVEYITNRAVYDAMRPLGNASNSFEDMFRALGHELTYLSNPNEKLLNARSHSALPIEIATEMFRAFVAGIAEGADAHHVQDVLDRALEILNRIPKLRS